MSVFFVIRWRPVPSQNGDFFANQVQHFLVDAAVLIFGKILQLAVGFAVNTKPQMFILSFFSHSSTKTNLKINLFFIYFKYILC